MYVCTGRLRPEVQPLFSRKRYLLCLPFIKLTNGTPFTYLVYNFASLLTVVNALSFKKKSIRKIERFLDFFKP